MRKRSASFWMLIGSCLLAGDAAAEVSYKGASLRDPFTDSPEPVAVSAPMVDMKTLANSLQVTGISYSEENPRAIVNGKIVSVGDPVGKMGTLSHIERDGITVNVNGKDYFFKQTFKQTQGKMDNDTSARNQ